MLQEIIQQDRKNRNVADTKKVTFSRDLWCKGSDRQIMHSSVYLSYGQEWVCKITAKAKEFLSDSVDAYLDNNIPDSMSNNMKGLTQEYNVQILV